MKWIEVDGLDDTNNECIDCPKGFYSNEGSPKCHKCEANQYLDIETVKMILI